MIEYINVLEDSYPMWEYCKEQEWTDMDYEDWYNGGQDLAFFEGDPDMIKIDTQVGYFCKCGNKVFYYFDDWFTNNAEAMLKAFFNAFETGITLGCESWVSGECPEGVSAVEGDYIWDDWESLDCGIAYRGGAGYCYWITDWSEWLEAHKDKKAA